MTNAQGTTSTRREFFGRSAAIAAGSVAVLHVTNHPAIGAGGADHVLPQFDPPGNLDDLSDEAKKRWSTFISDRMDREIAGDNEGSRLQFFNPTATATT